MRPFPTLAARDISLPTAAAPPPHHLTIQIEPPPTKAPGTRSPSPAPARHGPAARPPARRGAAARPAAHAEQLVRADEAVDDGAHQRHSRGVWTLARFVAPHSPVLPCRVPHPSFPAETCVAWLSRHGTSCPRPPCLHHPRRTSLRGFSHFTLSLQSVEPDDPRRK